MRRRDAGRLRTTAKLARQASPLRKDSSQTSGIFNAHELTWSRETPSNPSHKASTVLPEGRTTSRAFSRITAVLSLAVISINVAAAQASAAGEYAKHFAALAKLSIAVAEAMPADQYSFRPHPESMTFGELMSHIAVTNYQFCAGLKDTAPPAMPSPTGKDAIVKFLSDSFTYCSAIIPNLTESQLAQAHDSPDGHLPGREVLLAMYIHVAHHRGQAEIYLRDKGIKPPPYMI